MPFPQMLLNGSHFHFVRCGTASQAAGSITTYENDLYQLDLKAATWRELSQKSTNGVLPVGRIAMGLVVLAGKLYLFGGYGLKGETCRS